jgi:hypothetical protein
VQLSSVDKLPQLTSYCCRKKHHSTQREGLSFCGEAKALAVHAVCRCGTLCWSAGLLVSFSPLFGLGSMDVNVLMRAANIRSSYCYSTKVRSECLSRRLTFDGGNAKPSERLDLSRKLVGEDPREWTAPPRTRDVIPLHEAKKITVSAPNILKKEPLLSAQGPPAQAISSIAATGNVNGPRVCF